MRDPASTRRAAAEFQARLHKTALTFQGGGASDWVIYATVSKFNLAGGAGWSTAYGQGLFLSLANGRKIKELPGGVWSVE